MIVSERGIIETLEIEYELSKFIGIVSVTVIVLYWFCANKAENAGAIRNIKTMQ